LQNFLFEIVIVDFNDLNILGRPRRKNRRHNKDSDLHRQIFSKTDHFRFLNFLSTRYKKADPAADFSIHSKDLDYFAQPVPRVPIITLTHWASIAAASALPAGYSRHSPKTPGTSQETIAPVAGVSVVGVPVAGVSVAGGFVAGAAFSQPATGLPKVCISH
jgi:hypothetical protein